MAKPGDVVQFRSGLWGIEAPRNIAIYVDRYRKKGVPWAKVVTLEGEKELKAEHLSRRLFRDRFEGSLKETAAVQARLRSLVSQNEKGQLAEEAEDDLGQLEQELWEATCDAGGALTEEAIARAHYGDPSAFQLKQVRECLDRCRRAGTGRFETVAGRGDTWRPWTRDEVQRMRDAWQALAALRNRLVAVEETDEGRVFRRIDLDAAELDGTDRETLAWVKDAMVQFIEWDGVPDGLGRKTTRRGDGGAAGPGAQGAGGHDHGAGDAVGPDTGAGPDDAGGPDHGAGPDNGVVGIGGLGAVKVFGMDLHRQLGFLAQDWIRSEHTTTSSDYVHFLLESGLWSPDDAVAGLMRRHVNREPFFEHLPDEAAAVAADALPEPDIAQDPDREDLRHLECYTIDPPDAKDFDDAVGIEEAPDGTTTLWVHIADVSHYVRPGTPLDKHAKDRATSVYLPGRVLPMLPHRIADHLCSLRDDGDRFAVSAALRVDAEGRVQDASFHRAIIRVTQNLTYADALQRAEEGQGVFPHLLRLSKRMRRHRRGLALETGELKVLLEESGFTALEKSADPATRMIETFMVAANEAVARHLSEAGVGLLYRCHPLPDPEKAVRFSHQLTTMDIDVPFQLPERARKEGAGADAGQSLLDQLKAGGGRLELFGGGMQVAGGAADADDAADDPSGAAPEDGEDGGTSGFAALSTEEQEAWLEPFRTVVYALGDLTDRERAEVATLKLLACMGRAYYTPQNEGHFGLASSHYCHFTSPIRRYPDLVVHRNLKWLIAGGQGEPPHAAEDLGRMCDHCSDQEQAADALERRIKSSALVLASMTGDTAFSQAAARITGLTPASCFVRLRAGIEARIPARELPGGPYHVDEWESMLYLSDVEAPQRFDPETLKELTEHFDEEYGEMRRVRAKLADAVTVRLAGRNVADGKTEARLTAWRGDGAA